MKNIFKHLAAFAMLTMIMVPALVLTNSAGAETLDPWGGKEDDIQSQTGLGTRDPRDIAASIINVILGFLGIIAVIIILLGGFKWMTAAGNDDKVGEAKKLITAGIIGLAIILGAFAIAKFVIDRLINVTQ